MRIRFKKEVFEKIEDSFKVLKETPENKSAVENIEAALHECFIDYTFHMDIIGLANTDFYMSVFPELSTTNDIVDSIMNGKEEKIISNLWKTNKVWTIEIDKKILGGRFSEKELTAMLLHEIGHIACTDTIPSKALAIIQYEIAKQKFSIKSSARANIFRPVLSLPILDACVLDKKRTKSSIKEEIKADKFVKKMGYDNDLLSALNKVMEDYKLSEKDSIQDSMKKSMKLPIDTIGDVATRRNKLARNKLRLGHGYFESRSPFFMNAFDAAYESIGGNEDSTLAIGGRADDVIAKQIEEAKATFEAKLLDCPEDRYITEFFNFTKKHLKRIPPEEIDYIKFKTHEITSENDRLMLLTYLYSKLDIVSYYITILENPNRNKKYVVPYTIDELKALQKTLMNLRASISAYKIPMRHTHVMVSWPDNYEG